MNQRLLRLVELLYWVLAASIAVVAFAVVLSFAIGGTLATVKLMLFVVGFLLFGVGSIGIRPAPAAPHKDKLLSPDGGSQSRFEAKLQHLPPLNTQPLRFNDRIRRSWKIFLTSLLVLSISVFLEFELGFAVGAR